MTSTTKGPAELRSAGPFSTRGCNRVSHIPALFKSQDTTTMPYEFMPVIGQRVRYARKIVQSDGETARIGQIGTVIEVRDNTEAGDVFGPVAVVVHIDGEPAPGELRHEAVFMPAELEPVLADDTVPATDEEVVEYLTGTVPTAAERERTYVHKTCGMEITVPTGADTYDVVAAHEAACPGRPEQPSIGAEWNNVGSVDFWLALRKAPKLLDTLATLARTLSPSDVAGVMRRVADLLEEESR